MKNNWQTKKLEDCIDNVAYTTKIQRKNFLNDGEYPVVSQEEDLINGYWDKASDLFRINGPVIVFGDHTKILKYIDFDFVLGADGVKILQPKEFIFPKFFYYQLQMANLDSLGYARHYKLLKELEIKYPPLPEQKRIVIILDEVFEKTAKAKENAEKNLQNARELFASDLQSVFANPGNGWEEKKLGEIGRVSMCKRVFKDQTTSTGDIPFYKIGTFGKKPDAYISKHLYDGFRKKFSFPKNGDVLISASGTIGRRVMYDGEPAYFQDSNIVWIDNDEKQVLNDYLYHFYGACHWNSTKGATISRLYNDNLKQIKITFPKSLAEQRTIVRRLEALSAETGRLEKIYRSKVQAMVEFKKSILQKAFNGELV